MITQAMKKVELAPDGLIDDLVLLYDDEFNPVLVSIRNFGLDSAKHGGS
jgi:hypothetical protein